MISAVTRPTSTSFRFAMLLLPGKGSPLLAELRTSPQACQRLTVSDRIRFCAACSEVEVMPFEKVETQVDFPAQERAVLELWLRTGAFEQLRARNRGKPKWSFL